MTEVSGTLRGGIDLGGTKIEAIVIDSAQTVHGQSRQPTPTSGTADDIVAALATVMNGAAEAAGVQAAKLTGVGLGSPGEIDSANGTVSNASNVPGLLDPFPLGARLADALGTPVALGNDVSVATWAEFVLGAAKPYRHVLGVFWGTGVGGGLILDGKPWHGRGGAGEIGHMVIKLGGARCPCGRRGCMEAYAGRKAMEARAHELADKGAKTSLFELMEKKGRDRVTSGVFADALDDGDELTEKLFERAYKALGAGVASAVNLIDVEAVILGGGLGVRFGDAAVQRLTDEMAPHLFNDKNPPAVLGAALGDLGGAIGASLLANTPPPPG